MDATHSRRAPARALPGRLLALALAASAAWTAGEAIASSLQLAPVRVDFGPTSQAEAMQLTNSGKEAMAAQVRVMRWRQENGVDVLEPADDIVATPGILRIGPGQRQLVRLVRQRATSPARQQAYRVLVDQLPGGPRSPGEATVNLLLRYSVPLFVSATPLPAAVAGAAQPEASLSGVRAQVLPAAGGRNGLRVWNDGATSLRISGLTLQAGDAAPRAVVPGLVGYVLPGGYMDFPVAMPALAAGQTLKARFNDDREARMVPLVNARP